MGDLLIKSILKAAPKIGVEKIELIVLANNEAAINLYSSVGFEEEGRIKHYRKTEEKYTDALQMGLFLE